MNPESASTGESRTYADHEIVNLAVQSQDDTTDDVYSLDPLAEELDRDQVAELVHYQRTATVENGGIEFGLGFNVGEADFVEQAAGNQSSVDISDPGNIAVIYDEAGVIDFLKMGAADRTADGIVDYRELNLREIYGEGPFVDATDDLSIHIESFTGGTSQESTGEVAVQMAFAVYDAPDGVPRFSNPLRR